MRASRRFAELESRLCSSSDAQFSEREEPPCGALSPINTVRDHFEVLSYLYRLRDELGDGLFVDPFPGRAAPASRLSTHVMDRTRRMRSLCRWCSSPSSSWKNGAIDVLRAREIYAATMATALERIQRERQLQPPCSRSPRGDSHTHASRTAADFAACRI